MLKDSIMLVLFIFITLFAKSSLAAERLSYDSFYEGNEQFRKDDSRLNDIYKKLMGMLSWQEKRVLLDEQRKWHNKLFPILVENDSENTDMDKALSVLNKRIADLDKLATAQKADSIMGMPIAFGMSREQVAEKLGLADVNVLDAQAPDLENAYKIRLFGESVPVLFKFMKTTFSPFDAGECIKGFSSFLKTLKQELPAGMSENNQKDFVVTTLFNVEAVGMERQDDFTVLNEELSRKYKRAYPQFSRMAALLDENGHLSYGQDDENIADGIHEFFYEDRDRYIVVAGDWGTLTGEFGVYYISKAYLDLHVPSLNVLFENLALVQSYDDSLVLLPHDASINEIVYALGNRLLTYIQGPGSYYYLTGDYENDGRQASINVYLTPQNKAYGVTILYVESDFPGFEEKLLSSLSKKYKKLSSTPESVLNFIGHGNNFDMDFESGQNYIHIGATPHFATQHELTVIDKKVLPAYEKAYELQKKIRAQDAERHQDEARRESEKF